MRLTLSEFYNKLKWDLDHYDEAFEDYKRLRILIYLLIIIFFSLGFTLGFVLKVEYL